MKVNDKGMVIPAMFLMPFHGTRKEAMDRYYPEGSDASFEQEEFWSDLGEQDWLALVGTRDEASLIRKILRVAAPHLDAGDRDFAERLAGLIQVTFEHHDAR